MSALVNDRTIRRATLVLIALRLAIIRDCPGISKLLRRGMPG